MGVALLKPSGSGFTKAYKQDCDCICLSGHSSQEAGLKYEELLHIHIARLISYLHSSDPGRMIHTKHDLVDLTWFQ